jgi:hypothetical protein
MVDITEELVRTFRMGHRDGGTILRRGRILTNFLEGDLGLKG